MRYQMYESGDYTMRGTTHAAIGVASVYIIHAVSLEEMMHNPLSVLPVAAGYIAGLLCDIDTGTSTISNMLTPVKFRFFKKMIALLYFGLTFIALMKTHGTKYEYIVFAVSVFTGLTLSGLSHSIFYKIKRALLVIFSVVVMVAGISYEKYSLVLAGLFLAFMVFSPHRGYSHSLLAVAVSFGIVKYICSSFDIPDISIYFAIGMASHILADLFTEDGVTLLFPYNKRINLCVSIKTGSLVEHLITAAALCIIFFQIR